MLCVVFVGLLFAQSGEDFLMSSFNPYTQPGINTLKCAVSFEFNSDNAQMAMAAQFMPKMLITFTAPDQVKSEMKFSDSVPPMMQQMIKPMLEKMSFDKMTFVDYAKGLLKLKEDFNIGEALKISSGYELTLIPKNKKKNKMKSMILVFDNSKKLVKIKMTNSKNQLSIVNISYKSIRNYTVYDKFTINIINDKEKMQYAMIYGEYEINNK